MLAWCCCNKSRWIFHRVAAVLNAFQGENEIGDLFGPPWIWTDQMDLIRCALSSDGRILCLLGVRRVTDSGQLWVMARSLCADTFRRVEAISARGDTV